MPAGSAVGELVDLLVEVKDDGNRDDEGQQEHIGTEKTHEYVAVDALETDDAQEQSADGQQQSHDPAEQIPRRQEEMAHCAAQRASPAHGAPGFCGFRCDCRGRCFRALVVYR